MPLIGYLRQSSNVTPHGGPFSGVVYHNRLHYYWALGGNLQTNVGTSCVSIDPCYAWSYVDYLFGGSANGFSDDQ